jgi:hypothetical protein
LYVYDDDEKKYLCYAFKVVFMKRKKYEGSKQHPRYYLI